MPVRGRSARSGTGWGEHLDAAPRSAWPREEGEPSPFILWSRGQQKVSRAQRVGFEPADGKNYSVDGRRRASYELIPESVASRAARLNTDIAGQCSQSPRAVEFGTGPRSVQTRLRTRRRRGG